MTSTPAAGQRPPRRPRVLWLIKGLGLGGAERLLLGVAAARDREAFDYEAAYVLDSQTALAADLADTGVELHPLGARASWDLSWVWRLRRLLELGDFDILHAHLPYSAGFGRLVALSLPAKRRPVLVYTEHSLWNLAAVLTKALNRATVGMDSAMFVVSEASRQALPTALQERAEVLVHGVDRARSTALVERRPEMRASLRQLIGADDDEVVALTVANLRSEKGYDVLLEAASICLARGAGIRFVSVGWGPLEQSLAEESRERGLTASVDFLGRRSDTLELMAGADLFVLPSHQEGLPVALMEAMSVGLPVVATAVGGVPGALPHEVAGLVVPPGDAPALAEAVLRLSGDEELRAKLAEGSMDAGRRFDVAAAAGRIEDVYRRLLAQRTAPSTVADREVPLVLHVIPTAIARGAQREARALADGLDLPGRRHHRLVTLFAGPEEVAVDMSLGHDPGRGIVAQGFDPRLVRRLRTLFDRTRPALVVAHGGDPLKYVVPASLGRRRPIAYYATGTFGGAGSSGRLRLWRSLLRRTAVVACEGDEVLAECRDLLGVDPARLVLAPNGRDPARFKPRRRKAGAGAEDKPVVVFVGALNHGKGPELFVEVVAGLRRKGHDVEAAAYGDGPMRAELEEPARRAGVTLAGLVDDVAGVLGRADVMIFPSRPTGEGMPGVLIEAGLSAVAVVATAVPGTAAIVEDGVTGFVVPADDVEAMVDAAGRLVADRKLCKSMGQAARRRCTERFSLDSVVAVWTSFIEPLVEG